MDGISIMQPELLKLIRTLAGSTQAQLADAIGMSTTYYGLMERGRNAMEPRTALAVIQALDDIDRQRALHCRDFTANFRSQIRDLRIAQRHLHRGDDATAMAGIALHALANPRGLIYNLEINSHPGYLTTLVPPSPEPDTFKECLGPIDYQTGQFAEGVDSFEWWDQAVFMAEDQAITRGDLIEYAANRQRDLLKGSNYPAAVKMPEFWDLDAALPELMKRFAFEILYGAQLCRRDL